MPGYFCFFFAYEATRGLLASPGQSKDDIGPLRTVISGGVAGVTLWTVIFPADVVKSRLQVRLIKVKPNQMQNTISYISIALVIGHVWSLGWLIQPTKICIIERCHS